MRKHTNTNGSRVARKHTHPACAQARQVASQRHHTPVDESHPPLEATYGLPRPCAAVGPVTDGRAPAADTRPSCQQQGIVNPSLLPNTSRQRVP